MNTSFPYQKIAEEMRARIMRGDYTHQRLPSERKMMVEFTVQRATVRRALKVLEEEGHLYRSETGGRVAAAEPRRMEPSGAIALAAHLGEVSTAATALMHGLNRSARNAGRSAVWLGGDISVPQIEYRLPSLETLRKRGVEVMVVWPEISFALERLRELHANVPLILLDRRVPGFESDFVGFQDVAAAGEITRHLLSLGHRRIGFVATEPYFPTVHARTRGYLQALQEAGVAPLPEWVFYCDWQLGLPKSLLTRYILDGDPLTAIVCANDVVAMQMMVLLHELGRRVPEDVAVTGFGNMLPPMLDALRLTTMAQPFEQMGWEAGQIALTRLERSQKRKRSGIREIELPMHLIVRGSCGAAARNSTGQNG